MYFMMQDFPIVINRYLRFAAFVIALSPWLELLELLPIPIWIGCLFDTEKNESEKVKV